MMSISNKRSALGRGVPAALLLIVVGCASTPRTRPQQQALEQRAQATIQEMTARDPSLAQVLQDAAGYVVFPSIGQGGFIVGGAQGVGVVYERGMPVGTARLTQASVGAQIGGQTFSEIIVLWTPQAVDRLRTNEFDLRADASVTVLRAGAAAATRFRNDVAVFVQPEFGLMAEAAIGGQRISFQPLV